MKNLGEKENIKEETSIKAVILAAGRGERMMPLTAKTPKPLLKVNGKPIIDYIFDALPKEIDEVIVVVKYLKDQIIEHLSEKGGRLIRYVTGSNWGNAYSFLATKKYLNNERFLLIYGDEIPTYPNIEKCLKEDLSILTFNGGVYDGVMVLNTDIFKHRLIDENFKTLVEKFAKYHKATMIENENFIGGINTPEDLTRVRKEIKKRYG